MWISCGFWLSSSCRRFALIEDSSCPPQCPNDRGWGRLLSQLAHANIMSVWALSPCPFRATRRRDAIRWVKLNTRHRKRSLRLSSKWHQLHFELHWSPVLRLFVGTRTKLFNIKLTTDVSKFLHNCLLGILRSVDVNFSLSYVYWHPPGSRWPSGKDPA